MLAIAALAFTCLTLHMATQADKVRVCYVTSLRVQFVYAFRKVPFVPTPCLTVRTFSPRSQAFA